MPSHPKPSRSSRARSRWPFRSWGSRGDSLSRRRARRAAGRLGFQPLETRCVLSAAPVLDTLASPQLATIVEDAAAPAGAVGTLVSALVDAGGPLDNFSDTDGDLPGIAITGTNLQGGTLWYSVDGGASWLDVGAVTAVAPRYLAADATTRLYFQPAADFAGTIADVISFKAWDRTGILEQIGGDIEETTAHQFGQAVSISADGGTIAIGSPSSSFNRGRVQVYRWDGTAWSQLGAGFGGLADGDRLGWNVSLSADGNTVALGAPFAAGPGGANAGYVQLYHWTGSTWSPRGTSFRGEAGDGLGFSTAVSADGGTVAIGAQYNDGNGSDAGRVRIYRWNGTSWTQVGSALDGESAGDNFGAAVSISADGGTVAIGARRHDGTNGSDSGHVRVYRLIDDAWTPLGIDIEGEAADDQSGFSVSLSADGITVAIGAIYNDGGSGLGADDRGHVRVHRWDGSVWHQLGADIDGAAAGDQAGWSISLSGDGETVAIGSPSRDGPNGFNSGQVRVYGWTGSAWRQIGADIDGEATPASLGWSVSLSANASSVAIGAPFAGVSFLGRVRVHRLAPQASSTSTAIDTVSVGVTDVNDTPTDIALSTTSIAENSGPDALVGTLTTTDPDAGDTFAYLLVPGVGDTDNAAFTIVGDQVRATASFDFETKNSYSIRVRAFDQGGLFTEKAFTIDVTNVNEPPTDIALSATSIPENAGSNVLVGILSTTDPDGGEWYTYSYELVPGAGSSGNDAFEIVNNTLRARGSLNHERTPSLEIRVRSTDAEGGFVERSFTITVTDVNERPAIDHILPPADGSYRAGRPLVFTAVLTQPVTRVGRGAIDIGLGVGRATKPAVLVGGLGSNRLRFQYTPVRGDTDTDGVALGRKVRLARGVQLRDAQGRKLSLAVPAVATRRVRVDTTAPVVRSLVAPALGTYRPGQELLFTAVLSERVTVTGSGPTIAFSFGSARRLATYESGSGTNRLVFRYVVQPGDVARGGITIAGQLGLTGTKLRDAAGNAVVPTFQAPSGSRIILARARPAPSAAASGGLT